MQRECYIFSKGWSREVVLSATEYSERQRDHGVSSEYATWTSTAALPRAQISRKNVYSNDGSEAAKNDTESKCSASTHPQAWIQTFSSSLYPKPLALHLAPLPTSHHINWKRFSGAFRVECALLAHRFIVCSNFMTNKLNSNSPGGMAALTRLHRERKVSQLLPLLAVLKPFALAGISKPAGDSRTSPMRAYRLPRSRLSTVQNITDDIWIFHCPFTQSRNSKYNPSASPHISFPCHIARRNCCSLSKRKDFEQLLRKWSRGFGYTFLRVALIQYVGFIYSADQDTTVDRIHAFNVVFAM